MVAVGMTVLGIVGFNADDEDFANWKGDVVATGPFGPLFLIALPFWFE